MKEHYMRDPTPTEEIPKFSNDLQVIVSPELEREIERVTKMPNPQSVPLIMNNSNDRNEDAHER